MYSSSHWSFGMRIPGAVNAPYPFSPGPRISMLRLGRKLVVRKAA